ATTRELRRIPARVQRTTSARSAGTSATDTAVPVLGSKVSGAGGKAGISRGVGNPAGGGWGPIPLAERPGVRGPRPGRRNDRLRVDRGRLLAGVFQFLRTGDLRPEG